MQIQVNIDEELLRTALQASGMPSRAAVIEEGLRLVIALRDRVNVVDLYEMYPLDIKHPRRH